jgi:uncharacterized protein YgiM (DUF1202 family)
MKARYWSLVIVMLLVNYLIFSALFNKLLSGEIQPTRSTPPSPIPTFTPAPAELPPVILPTHTPTPIIPTPTATRVLPGGELSSGGDGGPASLIAPGQVNIRSGPGDDYEIIGTLNPDIRMPVIGRSADNNWWQIEITADNKGWVAGDLVEVANPDSAPVVSTP